MRYKILGGGEKNMIKILLSIRNCFLQLINKTFCKGYKFSAIKTDLQHLRVLKNISRPVRQAKQKRSFLLTKSSIHRLGVSQTVTIVTKLVSQKSAA